jgi:hypothetical protein
LKSRTLSQPSARQKRVTEGSLTRARRASSAMLAWVANPGSASTASATRCSDGRSEASIRRRRETMSTT